MDMTPNLNLPIPNADAVPPTRISEEFPRLAEALIMLDAIIFALQGVVAGKAESDHTQAISTITGLTEALASKMPANTTFSLDSLTDVQGAADALVNYVLVKKASGQWEPSTALAALGPHGHLLSEITGLVDALAGKSDVGHAHAIANVTGLQTALDGKANASDLSSAVPAGAVLAFARNTAPTGWLKANGAAVSRTTYAALFSAIGTTFGAGDGSATFNLPNLRGEFVRGWDDARGIDSGRAFGSAQADAFESHTHTGSTNSTGAHTHQVPAPPTTGSVTGISSTSGSATAPGSVTTSSAGAHSHTVTINAAGGTETRPRNVALLYCIKF